MNIIQDSEIGPIAATIESGPILSLTKESYSPSVLSCRPKSTHNPSRLLLLLQRMSPISGLSVLSCDNVEATQLLVLI